MGTKCAPSYANLFMGMFQEEYILPLIKEKTLIYLRYIDDIFFIWTGSKEKLNEIFTKLNTLHHSIKFDMTSSQTEINFLDTEVMKAQMVQLKQNTTKNQLIDHHTYTKIQNILKA